MKRLRQLLIGLMVLGLAMALLVGCVSKSDYEALQAEYTALVAEKESVKADYDKLSTEHEGIQGEKTALIVENESLKTKYDELDAEHEALQAEKATLIVEKESLEANYDELNADCEGVKKELAEIKEVYPPRDFSSLTELRDWLLTNDVSEKPISTYAEDWYGKALEIQEDALKDGYIVSADYDYDEKEDLYFIFCVTIINGDVWYWDPETDELSQDYSLGKVK